MKRIRPNEVRQAQRLRYTAPELAELTDAELDYRLELEADAEADDTPQDQDD